MQDDTPILEALNIAPLHPEAWAEAAARLADLLGGGVAHLQLVELATGRVVECRVFPPDAPCDPPAYRGYYGRISPRRELALRVPAGEVFSCSDHFDERFVARNEFYQDYAIPYGARHLLGVRLAERHGVAALFAVTRDGDAGRFDAGAKTQLSRFSDALGRAATLQIELGQLRSQADLALRSLHALPQAAFVVDDSAVLRLTNPSADLLLSGRCTVVLRAGRLTTAHTAQAGAFARAISLATHPDTRRVTRLLLTRQEGLAPASVTVCPLHDPLGAEAAAAATATLALVVVRKPEQAPTNLDAIADFFGLTPSEARIAAALAAGDTPETIAQTQNISISTVRWHLKSIYSKAGVGRQAEFIAVMRQLAD